MRIGYYLGHADIRAGGTGPYAWRILNLLLCNSKDHAIKFLILCTKENRDETLALINKYQAQAKAEVCLVPFRLSFLQYIFRIIEIILAKLLPGIGISKRLDLFFSPRYRWFSSLAIDLLHFPTQTPPFYDLPYPFIVTMHDVQELHFPEYFTPEERAYRAEYYWKSLKNATSVIVSFNHVKKDLVKYFNLPEAKAFVCPLPYNHIRLNHPREHEAIKYAEKYDSLDGFILYPAQTWRHKNHLNLIKAIELVKNQSHRSINLVCTGKKNSYYYDHLHNYLVDSSVSTQVLFTGVLPESELFWLYKNCSLVVIPTLYEAGSFPLLEAMFLDVPVICSSVTSLPETIGDSRFIFDPLDVEGMSRLIVDMLDSIELRKDNIKNSRSRINQLSQIDSCQSFYNTWRTTLKP